MLFCLIVSVLSATAGGAARRSGSELSETAMQRRRPAKAPPEPPHKNTAEWLD